MLLSCVNGHGRCWGILAAAGVWASIAQSASPVLNPVFDPSTKTTLSTINPASGGAYIAVDTNACAVSRNLVTAGSYQFAGYYDTSGRIILSRRELGSSTWQTVDSGLTLSSSLLSDDHNVISMGVDGDGYMHLSWGLHNASLTYAVTSSPVTGSAWNGTLAMNSAITMPSTDANSTTYPEFYNVRNSDGSYSKDLLFVYRNGGAGGGSGNGNTYINRYDSLSRTWSHSSTPAIAGIDRTDSAYRATYGTGYNAYNNRFVYGPTGKLITTWTWRETADYQSNHDIVYSESLDNGQTWLTASGTYAATITQSNDRIIKAIPTNYSLINQTSTALDKDGNPMMATWWATINAAGRYNRQYQFVYYDPTTTGWINVPLTDRTSDNSTTRTISVNYVRQMGRPIVLSDDQRVYVVARYSDASNGVSDDIRVFYSSDKQNWSTLVLSTEAMGSWEPVYDERLWESQHILSLLYQPIGTSDPESGYVQVLNWDTQAYFASVPEPSALGLLAAAPIVLGRRRPAHQTTWARRP